MKGIIHLHSFHSYDSAIGIDSIIDFAISNELDFIILTDHDSISGSLALRQRIEELGLSIIVPIAAEYCTEYGDVIESSIYRFFEFVSC